MWAAVAIAVAKVIEVLCRWGIDAIDRNAERRKKRAEIGKEIQSETSARAILRGITRYNAVR